MVKNHLPINLAGSPIYAGFMMHFAVDLFNDLVHPYIAASSIPIVAIAGASYHLYQYRQKPLSPDLARHFQGGRGSERWLVPYQGLDTFHPF